MNKLVLMTGCSGGGKSTLLAALAARGFNIVEEPGRRIVREELRGKGHALPWVDLAAFARRAIATTIEDHQAALSNQGWTFFDRGLVDAVVALHHATGESISKELVASYPYHDRVFVVPPWPEIYASDAERRHGYDDAVAEYDRLTKVLPRLGYTIVPLPKVAVRERVDFMLDQLALSKDRPTAG